MNPVGPKRKLIDIPDKEFWKVFHGCGGNSARTAKFFGVDSATIRRERISRTQHLNGNASIDELIQQVQADGYLVTKEAQQQDYHFDGVKLFKLGDCKVTRLAFVGDCHMGSRFQQISNLSNFYKLCEAQNVDAILHMGDISDGQRMYPGQEYEVFKHGADAQVDYIVNTYPDAPSGIKTFLIGGNHDESHYTKGGGHDIISAIADKRKDIQNLGFHQATISFGKISVKLMHPTGGVAYARSYRMQKIIEQMPPDEKPDFLCLGHYHVTAFLMGYRDVMGFQLPCFQSQTPYLAKKGLYPEIGAVIINIRWIDDRITGGIKSVNTDWISYRPVKEDW